jgi:hypothetical protein
VGGRGTSRLRFTKAGKVGRGAWGGCKRRFARAKVVKWRLFLSLDLHPFYVVFELFLGRHSWMADWSASFFLAAC